MRKIIEVNKSISRSELDKKLTKLPVIKVPIDLGKYFGKIKFSINGLAYQLKSRDEWYINRVASGERINSFARLS